jgi:hypothetical protein
MEDYTMKVQTGSRSSVALLGLVSGLCMLVALLALVTFAQNRLPLQFPATARASDLDARDYGNTAPRIALAAGPPEIEIFGWQTASDPSQAMSIDQIVCTLAVTTTDKVPVNNHSFQTAATLAPYTDQTLVTGAPGEVLTPWEDYYRLDNALVNYRYTIQARPDFTNNYNLGMVVYLEGPSNVYTPIVSDTNTFSNIANVTFVANSVGPYFVRVFQTVDGCTGRTYSIIPEFTAPTPMPSPTPTDTPEPTPGVTPSPQPTVMTGWDQYEPNFSFELATTIAPGVAYQMNFIPWGGAQFDNDYLKIRVKPGLQLTCYTSNLDPGVDPNMKFFTGPGDEYFIMANDDIEPGNFNSRLSTYITYEGWLYILIGQGERMAKRDTVNSDYTIQCDLGVPGAPTPPPGATLPPGKAPDPTPFTPPVATPVTTPTPPVSPIETPTPPTSPSGIQMTFRLVTTPEPTTPTPEPSGFRTFRVLVYLDENRDGQMGAGEGVSGFFVQVVTPDGRRQLAQGYTDEQGQLSFTVPTVSTVRVLVPLLGYDRLVDASRPEVRVRIVPPPLPDAIP